ncbi:MAG TPA: metallophosphoesterase family protein [Candidatus Omnitrophota bacterium]|nr:metallophosphoesterase family protein [Candidatus Omnitrophota bacterium]
MRIGVISDTHIPIFSSGVPLEIRRVFSSCDLIVHAGDMVDVRAMEEFRKIAETKAVQGNMDSEDLKKTLPEHLMFEAGGKKIGVVHGRGSGKAVLEWVKDFFKSKPDIVIFGHSHLPFNEKIGGTLYFNPGSATDTMLSGKRTYGIISIENGDVKAEIVEIGTV